MYEWIIWWLENFNSSPPKLTIIYAPQSSHLVMHYSTVLTTYVSRHVVTVIILCKLQHCLNSWSVRQGQCHNNLSKTTQIACSRMTTTMFSHRGRESSSGHRIGGHDGSQKGVSLIGGVWLNDSLCPHCFWKGWWDHCCHFAHLSLPLATWSLACMQTNQPSSVYLIGTLSLLKCLHAAQPLLRLAWDGGS